ncbi:hypothetical protein G6F60_015310 [Rhizopus arrhizus]|nr:hypothetical protein G6F60_015310 [Rhizopus arrhizus]
MLAGLPVPRWLPRRLARPGLRLCACQLRAAEDHHAVDAGQRPGGGRSGGACGTVLNGLCHTGRALPEGPPHENPVHQLPLRRRWRPYDVHRFPCAGPAWPARAPRCSPSRQPPAAYRGR